MTQMLIVADDKRSVSFYRDVLGATVLREYSPAMLRFHNGWLVINSGGGPTPDKPEVTMTPPEDSNRVSTLVNVRVADMATVYREWNQHGAQFLTEPLDNHGAAALLPARPRRIPDRARSNHTPHGPRLTRDAVTAYTKALAPASYRARSRPARHRSGLQSALGHVSGPPRLNRPTAWSSHDGRLGDRARGG
jgi:catechol 2,3-dioxygenase-like lactoylglutathione lyase family enzyme